MIIYGERVRQVREMHRITQHALVELVPTLTQSQLSRIESGLTGPDPETVALIAASLGVTPDFFERPPAPPLTAHTPQLRARTSRLTQGVKASAMQWARLVDEEYERLKREAKSIPGRLERQKGATPTEAARAVRVMLGFGPNEPLPYLVLAVERLGVTVLGLPYSADALDAFCCWREGRPIIGVLGDVPGDRLRFSVAHEIGHLVLHDTRDVGKQVEDEADQFAAELLTPLAAIERWMPNKVTLSVLIMMKTQWGVSVKGLIRRARELGTIDQERATGLYRQVSARGWNRAEPGHVPREKPRAFRKLAEIYYGNGINIERLAADAGWSQELALQVLNEHATADELPFQSPPRTPDRGTNVVEFRPRSTWHRVAESG